MTLTECCEIILDECPNQYAKSYALAWLDGRVKEDAMQYGILLSDAAKTQALYILSNIGTWRGDRAKQVRQALKALEEC